jgi:hypothetical protein
VTADTAIVVVVGIALIFIGVLSVIALMRSGAELEAEITALGVRFSIKIRSNKHQG